MPEPTLEEEMRKQDIIETALRRADEVITEQGVGAEQIAELSYEVALKMMEKVGFFIHFLNLKTTVSLEIDPAFHQGMRPMYRCDVREATHVKTKRGIQEIISKWGITDDGKLYKPSEGGFGVVTRDGTRINMMEALAYLKAL